MIPGNRLAVSQCVTFGRFQLLQMPRKVVYYKYSTINWLLIADNESWWHVICIQYHIMRDKWQNLKNLFELFCLSDDYWLSSGQRCSQRAEQEVFYPTGNHEQPERQRAAAMETLINQKMQWLLKNPPKYSYIDQRSNARLSHLRGLRTRCFFIPNPLVTFHNWSKRNVWFMTSLHICIH